MFYAPQQNWTAYELLTRENERQHLRSLTFDQKFTLYQDIYRLASAQHASPGDFGRLAQLRWKEKLALRQKMVKAFSAMG